MPAVLRLAVSQTYSRSNLSDTIDVLHQTVQQAAGNGVDLVLFPEAFLGAYPRGCTFGAAIGMRSDEGREQFLAYWKLAVDLGDTPLGAGDAWIDRELPVAKGQKYRGDGTRERLEAIARETGVFIVTGVVERAGGSLYCSVLYVDPTSGCCGKRRKVLPTGSERLVWAQSDARSLRAVVTVIKGVRLTLAAAICWENYMPLLRYSLYSQNVNLYLAPTADARDTWLSLMRTVAIEGRTFVLSANQCQRQSHMPSWISSSALNENSDVRSSAPSTTSGRRRSSVVVKAGQHELILPSADLDPPSDVAPRQASTTEDNFICRGGSCIIGPLGQVLAGPLWEVEEGGLLVVDADFEDCERGRLDLDTAGSYSRNDLFHLDVTGFSHSSLMDGLNTTTAKLRS